MKTISIFSWMVLLTIFTVAQQAHEIEWVDIPGGTFLMGSPDNEFGREAGELQHQVTISPFSISKCEITFEQYDRFCEATGKRKPSDKGWGRGKRPVINVSWIDANDFAKWVKGRLPTEAEWEYACRAGTSSPFSTGENISTSQANYDGNYPYHDGEEGAFREKTLPVGSFDPNPWGLYDMHGNVWEWCNDWLGTYSKVSQTDPEGPSRGQLRIGRGGSWKTIARRCRSAYRFGRGETFKADDLGFRVVKDR